MLRDDEDTAGIRIHLENEALKARLSILANAKAVKAVVASPDLDLDALRDKDTEWDPERGCYVFQVHGEIAVWPEEID